MHGWGVRVVTTVAIVAAYVALATVGAQVVVLERLTVWYAPAGLGMAVAAIWGWRTFPALALGEVLAEILLFSAVIDLGWLVVPHGLTYAAVLTAGGRVMATLGGTSTAVSWRRPLNMVMVGAVATPLATALMGVTFRAAAGVVDAADVPRSIVVWALGDAVGAASIGVTVVTAVVRRRRGGRWWALPDMSTPLSTVLVLTPAALVLVLAAAFDGIVPFVVVALVPYVALCVIGGVPAAGLAAPTTSLAVTYAGVRAFGDDLVQLTDLQLLLLLVLVVGLFAGMVVEERRELTLRLGERERHLRRAEVQARAGSFQWDVRGDTIWWSDGLLRLLDRDTQPVRPVESLLHVHPDDRPSLRKSLLDAVRAGIGLETTCRVSTSRGDELVLRVIVTTRRFDGRVVEAVGTATDVTAEESARSQLAEALTLERSATETQRLAADEATRAAAMTARAERIREALLIAVSHEIRTPLTVVRGLVESMRTPGVAEHLGPRSAVLERLDRNTRRLERVLTDLLDVDRIGRGVIEPRRRAVALRPLIDDVVARSGIDPTLVDVTVGDHADVVALDPGITARIVEHLLLNAKRHAPGAPVDIRVDRFDGRLELRVADRGPGLPPTDPDELFDAFHAARRDRSNPGTGVGLYLVDQFTALQGGSVNLDSRDGGGTTVTIVLPVDATMLIELPEVEHDTR